MRGISEGHVGHCMVCAHNLQRGEGVHIARYGCRLLIELRPYNVQCIEYMAASL